MFWGIFLFIGVASAALAPVPFLPDLTSANEQYLLNGGWEKCASFSPTSDSFTVNLNLGRCTSTYLGVGCRPTGATEFRTVASAPRIYILGNAQGKVSSTQWYGDPSNNYTMRAINAFTTTGPFDCDTLDQASNPAYPYRSGAICWKNLGTSGGYLWCGEFGRQETDFVIEFFNLPCYGKNIGDSCRKGNYPCESGDTCQDTGTCDGGTDVPVPSVTPCQALGLCNATTISYNILNKPANTSCVENYCLKDQQCDGLGSCILGTFKGCGLAPACQTITNNTLANCISSTGKCGTQNILDGTSCSVDSCKSDQTCLSGSCQGGTDNSSCSAGSGISWMFGF